MDKKFSVVISEIVLVSFITFVIEESNAFNSFCSCFNLDEPMIVETCGSICPTIPATSLRPWTFP